MRLLDKDGKEAEIGKSYFDFRGETHVLQGIVKPHKPSSTGRVQTDIGEYFPGVLDFKWVEREDH